MQLTRVFDGRDVKSLPDRPGVVYSRIGHLDVRHVTRNPSIKFVLKGNEAYSANGRTVVLGPGDMLLVGPDVELKVRARSRQNNVGLCACFEDTNGAGEDDAQAFGGAGAAALHGLANRVPFIKIPGHASRVSHYIASLSIFVDQRGGAVDKDVRKIHSDLNAGMRVIMAEISEKIDRVDAKKHSTRVLMIERLEQLRAYLRGNWNRQVSLDEAAAVASISKYHLSRVFGSVYGVSVIDYHDHYRLSRAKEAIDSGNILPAQAPARYGYSDYAAFLKAFKRVLGCTPTERI